MVEVNGISEHNRAIRVLKVEREFMSAQILSIGSDSFLACLVIVADSEGTVDSRIDLFNSRDEQIEIGSWNIQIVHHWIKGSLSGFSISYDHIVR